MKDKFVKILLINTIFFLSFIEISKSELIIPQKKPTLSSETKQLLVQQDSYMNIPQSIVNKLEKNLHKIENHPLGIIKALVEQYMNNNDRTKIKFDVINRSPYPIKLDKIQFTDGLPKTRSGKIMRRILRKIANNDISDLGDTSTLLNPEVVEEIILKSKNQ